MFKPPIAKFFHLGFQFFIHRLDNLRQMNPDVFVKCRL